MNKEKVMLLAAESYKQALVDIQKVINEMFAGCFAMYEKNIKDLQEKISSEINNNE